MGLRGIINLGLRPKPPAATRGDPIAPLCGRRGALCAAWGTGASMSPSPLPPTCTDLAVFIARLGLRGIINLGLRGIINLGLRPKPPAATRGDPIAPLRGRRGALCAAWGTGASMSPSPFRLQPLCGVRCLVLIRGCAPSPHFSPTFCCGRRSARRGGPYSLTPLRRSYDYACSGIVRWGCAPNPRRLLAGTPSPRAAAAGPRRARLSFDPHRRLDALATNAGKKCGLTPGGC